MSSETYVQWLYITCLLASSCEYIYRWALVTGFHILCSGKFSQGRNFRDLRDQTMDNKSQKNFPNENKRM